MVDLLPASARPPRHTEWTRRKMALFLRELAASQFVHQAARSVGMSRQSAYRLRNRLAGTPFALAWEVALEAGLQQLAHAVLDRALNGVEQPHYYHGELVGTTRTYDNRLAAWLLANPWKLGRQQVAREYVSDEWDKLLERVEWEALDWQDGEILPGRICATPPPDELDEDYDPLAEEPAPDRAQVVAEYDQDDFVATRSWYAANTSLESTRPPRRAGRLG